MILGSLLSNVTVQNPNGSLQTVDCLEYAGVTCPESWIGIDGRCYRFFIESIEDPSLMCAYIGGYLAVYETEEEAESVLEIIQMTAMLYNKARWTFGLFHLRGTTSYLRYTNGAFVNESLRTRYDEDDFQCYAHTSFNASDIIGVDCGKYAYICEKGPDYRGCYLSAASQNQYLIGYRDLTVTQCLETCKGLGKMLAGVRYQNSCHCIGSGENITKTLETNCEQRCARQQNCGASLFDYMTVYAIDYSKNASSCEDLFNQGVLLSGLYSLANGVRTWCGMKNSSYLAKQIEFWTFNGSGEVNFTNLSWHRVGIDNVTLAIEVMNSSRSNQLYQRCTGVFLPASITATLKTIETQLLVGDVLKWSLDTPVSSPSYVGLIDQFYMGMYTWSDGSLFRLSQIKWTEFPQEIFENSTLATYMQYTVGNQFLPVNSTETFHAVCQRDASYKGCLQMTSMLPSSWYAVKSYNSMSLTVCRQICQVNATNHALISAKDCICYDPVGVNFNLMTFFNTSTSAQCDLPCPGNELQKCGGTNNFRQYTIDQDVAESCEDLYNNFVHLPNTYLINGSEQFCGIDDLSSSCPLGFIAKQNKCYRFYRQQTLNVQSAAQTCLSQGGYLAAPSNVEELDVLTHTIQNISTLRTAELWLVGYYSPFANGLYVTSQGHMLSVDDPLTSNIKTVTSAKMTVALNITSGHLVTVPFTTALPFVCQLQEEISGCSQVAQSDILSSFQLTSGMSIQQCLAYCRGFTKRFDAYSLLQETVCSCMKADTQLNLTQATCKKACSGNFMQQCGSTLDKVYSVYKLAKYSSQHLQYSCNDLLSYGVVLPATYFVDTLEYITCFKFSYKSILILNSPSTTTSSKAIMRLLALNYQVTSPTNFFFQFQLNQFYVIEGFVLYGSMKQISITTSLDNLFYESHPDNIISVNTTTLRPFWITLSQPVVAKWVKIKFESWSGNSPNGSAELVGYLYSVHNFTYHYRGCHKNFTIENQYSPVSTSYDSCRQQCKENGLPYMILKSPDMCKCAGAQAARDFYGNDTQTCSDLCFGGNACSNDDYTQALYLTTDVSCPLLNISNSKMSISANMNANATGITPLLSQVTYTCLIGHEINSTMTSINSTCSNFEKWIPSLTNITCQ
ncbi:macrophage mannose receptor 1, partial [Biomphalaria glabrata]